jgi:DNA-binding NtrC family response regulator
VDKKRILILDDNEHVGWALKVLLQDDYVVDLVFTQEEAVFQVQSGFVDLILLDYHLEHNLTGEQVLEDLQKIQPNIRAVLVTANSNLPGGVFLNPNFRQVVTKPFDIFELKKIIFEEINK